MPIRLLEWGDDLLGRQVFYYDTSLRDPGKARAATIVGPGVERGCVDLLVMGRGKTDMNRQAAFPSANVLLGLSIDDKAPGTGTFALLRMPEHTSLLAQPPHMPPSGATAEQPAGPGNAVSVRTLPKMDAASKAEKPEPIEIDDEPIEIVEEPGKAGKPGSKADALPIDTRTAADLLVEFIRPLRLGKASTVTITGDNSIDFGLALGEDPEEVAQLIRATYDRGWTFLFADAGGRLSQKPGIDKAVADADIKTMVSMMTDLILAAADAVGDTGGDWKVVSAAMKKKMKDIGSREYIAG